MIMNFAKRLLAFAMVFVLLLSSCVIASASAYASMSPSTSFSVVDGVNYAKYSVYGSSSGHTETATVLEFHPDDGYIPMAFAANAGSCSVLSTHYSTAVNKYGYEVAGGINGSYFDMTTGMLTGILISGGKVSIADIGYTYGNLLSVVAFGYDGSMNVVDSQLAYNLYINGTLVPDALRFINKEQGIDTWRTDAILYYDTSCGMMADTYDAGYEVICKKKNGSDLTVGGMLEAEVVQVNSNTSGTYFEYDSNVVSDNFVLYATNGTSYANYLSGLKVGDKVEISVEETVAASKTIMENASSVITNVGWLVKDGVDQTDYNSTIGDHSVSGTYARWTAFGQKADGTFVFFTSEGGDTGNTSRSLTLKDVAAAMMNLGCVNVIRLDGGGSTAMYVSNTGYGSPGYVMSHSRAVADCLLVVKNKPGKATLRAAINKAESISHTDYTEANLNVIRSFYETAKSVYADSASTEEDYAEAAERLNNALAKVGPSGASTFEGEQFWVTHFNDNSVEGSGAIMTQSYTGCAWSIHVAFSPVAGTDAYEITAISDGTDKGTGTPLAIPNGGFVWVSNYGNDYPSLYASNPSTYSWCAGLPDYTSDACTDMIGRALEWSVGDRFVFSGLDLSSAKVPTSTSSLKWYDSGYVCTALIGEYNPNIEDDRIKNGVYITGFNSSIVADACVIYTNDFNGGWISTVAANHNWTQNVLLTWDDSIDAYVVTSNEAGVGDDTPTYYVDTNQILIAAHADSAAGVTNKSVLANAEVGQALVLSAVDVSAKDLGVAPYVTFVEAESLLDPDVSEPEVSEPEISEPEVSEPEVSEPEVSEPEVSEPEVSEPEIVEPEKFTFWVTHFNDNSVEGSGAIMTQSYTGCAWSIHVAFSPVAGTNAYEITAISDGTDAGAGKPLAIPIGGFVWVSNYGNNYPAIYESSPGAYSWCAGLPDYTSDACTSMILRALEWSVGDRFVFEGLDLSSKTVPTSTSYLNWYDDNYVCTATYYEYVEPSVEPEDPEVSEPEVSEPEVSEPEVSEPEVSEPEVSEPEIVEPEKFTFWVTHFNDNSVEGSGAIMTKSYTGCAWSIHVAFSPVAGTNAYEITAISDGTDAGAGTPLSIPSGGFVWVSNYGNNYPAIYESSPGAYSWCAGLPDYTSDACTSMILRALEWSVGDKFVFEGLDISSKTVPTSTSYLKWYDDNYVCTATYYEYVEPSVEPEDPEVSEPEVSEPEVSEPEVSEPEVSEPEVSEPTLTPDPDLVPDDKIIAYIPLDDRPVNYDRGIYAALSAGYQIITPDIEALKTYLNIGGGDSSAWSFYVNGYNSVLGANGDSIIYTSSTNYTNPYWNVNVAFEPTSTANVYRIVAISDGGALGGKGVALSIPNGGFVWAGNNYGSATTTVSNVRTNWTVGTEVTFAGLDLYAGSKYGYNMGITAQVKGVDESRIGDRVAILEWLKDIYENGYNGKKVTNYVVSIDQLLSGGLVGSRSFADLTEMLDSEGNVYYDESLAWEYDAIKVLGEIAKNEDSYVVAFDTVMRLASTGNFLDYNLGVYSDLRSYGEVDRYYLSGNALTLENVEYYMDKGTNGKTISLSGYSLTQDVLDKYYASRVRKLKLTTALINTLGDSLDHYYIGVDDSHPNETLQSNEIRYFNKLISDAGIGDNVSLFAGADELGLLGIGAVASHDYCDDATNVNVQYFGGTQNYPADEYDTGTLKTTVEAHIEGAGAVVKSNYNSSYLQVLVLTRTTASGDFSVNSTAEIANQKTAANQLVATLKSNLANNIPTCIINAVGNNGGNMYLAEAMLDADIDIAKIYGYSQWNTVSNAVGIALGNAISRYAYLKDASENCYAPTAESNDAFIKGMTTAFVKDIAYIGAPSVYGTGRGDSATFNTWKTTVLNKINSSVYYTALGVTAPVPSVSVGNFDNLDNWGSRAFEAVIPVNTTLALGAKYTDTVLSSNGSGRTVNYNLFTGNITDGYTASSVSNTTATRNSDWYAFRTDYNDADNDGIIDNTTVYQNTENNVGSLVIDLGSEMAVDGVEITYGFMADNALNTYAPEKIVVYVSGNGEDYVAVATFKSFATVGGVYSVTSDVDSDARFVKVEVTTPNKTGAHVLIGDVALISANSVTDNER